MSPQFVTPWCKGNKNDPKDAAAICEAVITVFTPPIAIPRSPLRCNGKRGLPRVFGLALELSRRRRQRRDLPLHAAQNRLWVRIVYYAIYLLLGTLRYRMELYELFQENR
jgi:hypothetical protein